VPEVAGRKEDGWRCAQRAPLPRHTWNRSVGEGRAFVGIIIANENAWMLKCDDVEKAQIDIENRTVRRLLKHKKTLL
jgi:hypothetical protein